MEALRYLRSYCRLARDEHCAARATAIAFTDARHSITVTLQVEQVGPRSPTNRSAIGFTQTSL